LAQLLDLPVSAALGRPLQQLCPELDMQQALQEGTGEEDRVMRLGSHVVVSNLLPILENGERTGLALTCQDITVVQRADQRIRSTRRPGSISCVCKPHRCVKDLKTSLRSVQASASACSYRASPRALPIYPPHCCRTLNAMPGPGTSGNWRT
ncbi:hypothetical protein ACNFG0_13455, partial [Pseudomonas sp. NY15372]